MSSENTPASQLQSGQTRHGLTLLQRTPGKSRPYWDAACPLCRKTVSIRADVLAGEHPLKCPGCRAQRRSQADVEAANSTRKDYTGQTFSDGRFVVKAEAGRDKHGYVLWETVCTACGHTRELRKKDLPAWDSYCRRCSAKSPARKPRPGAIGRFRGDDDLNSQAPCYLWWVTNVRTNQEFPDAFREHFDDFLWDCCKATNILPSIDRLTGLETARLVKVDPGLPWDWSNVRIAPVRGRADPKSFGSYGEPPPVKTKDGLFIHATQPWGSLQTYFHPLPDDQWVDPDSTKDLTLETLTHLIENSDRF